MVAIEMNLLVMKNILVNMLNNNCKKSSNKYRAFLISNNQSMIIYLLKMIIKIH